MTNYFTELNEINVNEHTEKKNGLTYLSWAWAWSELKKKFPDATYTVYENKDEWNYFTDGHTGWVKTGVTVNGIEHIEYLPIMDFKNKSIPCENITSFDVNKAIQRSLTKAVARHGLGLYIYAGEDLPEEPEKTPAEKAKETREQTKANQEELLKRADGCIKFLEQTKQPSQKQVLECEELLKKLNGDVFLEKANRIAELLLNLDKIEV